MKKMMYICHELFAACVVSHSHLSFRVWETLVPSFLCVPAVFVVSLGTLNIAFILTGELGGTVLELGGVLLHTLQVHIL